MSKVLGIYKYKILPFAVFVGSIVYCSNISHKTCFFPRKEKNLKFYSFVRDVCAFNFLVPLNN